MDKSLPADSIVVIGLGRFGTSVARSLVELGHDVLAIDSRAEKVQALADAAKRVNPDILCLCHGGPIANPEDAEYILRHCPECHGFYGASSMERLPVEGALTEQTRKFKAIRR